MNYAYQVDHVSYSYPLANRSAIENLSLSIVEGKTTALLGPNGAGKSTLMDLLLRWKQPDEGTITLFGMPLAGYTKRKLGQTVSLVPQEESSRFSFTVLDYVLFGRSPYIPDLGSPDEADVAVALDAIECVGLSPIAHRSVTTLSGGEHQLLLLARALAQQPKVLLLDEPTSSLDPGNTDRVVRILERLTERGITLFFTTHDPSLAAQIAHYVAMIARSRLLFSGPTEEALVPDLLSRLYGIPMNTIKQGSRLFVIRS